jgi:ABC-type glycerol-3-phosphate transport system permease component
MTIAISTRARGGVSTGEWVLRKVGRLVLYAVIIFGAIVFAFPFFWMVSTSLKPEAQVMLMPPVWVPQPLVWENYIRPFTNLPFPTFFKNTIIITALGMAGVLISSSLCAFGFARMRFPFRDTLFVLMLATLMLPYPVTMIPTYVFFAKAGLINTFAPLIAPEWLGSPFLIFLLRQYIMTIPLEMDDAARIDGCGWFGLYWRIIMPLSAPALGVAAIYSFNFHWNDFVRPVIYLTQLDMFTVPLGVALLRTRYTEDYGGMMAVSTLSMLPVLIVFFAAQRQFIQGIVISGVKG